MKEPGSGCVINFAPTGITRWSSKMEVGPQLLMKEEVDLAEARSAFKEVEKISEIAY